MISFENLALVELPSLAVNTLPLPILVDHSLGLRQGGVQFLPVVARVVPLPVLVQIKGELMAFKDPDGGDAAVVVLPEHAGRGEGVLVELVQSLEHSAHEVTGHEDLG